MLKRMLPPAYLLVAIVLTIALHFLVPLVVPIAFPWRLAGLAPVAAGIALNILADLSFKQHHTTVKPFERSTALVTQGVFGSSRNPMYLGMVLMVAGVALFLGSLSPWLIVAGFAALLDRVFIAPEEAKLRQSFGAAYDDYAKRVRRWL
ncbi:MAG: methyltransferase family protein [Hyphomicrobiales bacterium]